MSSPLASRWWLEGILSKGYCSQKKTLPLRKRIFLFHIRCLRGLLTAVFYKISCRRREPFQGLKLDNLLDWAADLFPLTNENGDGCEDGDRGAEVPEPHGFWVKIRGQKFRLGDVTPPPAPKRAPFGPLSVFRL